MTTVAEGWRAGLAGFELLPIRPVGVAFWAMLAVSAGLLAWVLMLLSACRRQTLCPAVLYSRLVELLGKGDGGGAARLAGADPSVLARLVEAALQAQPDRADTAVAHVVAGQRVRWGDRIGPLLLAGAVAPMAGLLGTGVGLIAALAEGSAGRSVPPETIAAAIVPACQGLAAGILCLVAHAVLRRRVNRVLAEAAARTGALMDLYRQSLPGRALQ